MINQNLVDMLTFSSFFAFPTTLILFSVLAFDQNQMDAFDIFFEFFFNYYFHHFYFIKIENHSDILPKHEQLVKDYELSSALQVQYKHILSRPFVCISPRSARLKAIGKHFHNHALLWNCTILGSKSHVSQPLRPCLLRRDSRQD